MTIQRQYNLPNCKLVVEGFGDDATPNPSTGRPLLSMLTHVECHFLGQATPLSGGREFLESLMRVVSNYAQEFLSGVPHPSAHDEKEIVQLQRVDDNIHRLTAYSTGNSATPPTSLTQVDLRTVQLFDLVEAIDQLYADAQTLPDLSLQLAPVSRRYAISRESMAKQVTPLAIGLSSLAVMAIAFFFLPVPEVRIPEDPATQESPASVTPNGSPSPETQSPPEASPTSDNSPSAESSPSPEADASPSPEASPSPTEESTSTSPGEFETLLGSAPEITNLSTLEELNDDLRTTLSEAWTREPVPDEPVIYRVGVAENGDILGFKQSDQAAIDYTDSTPLTNLLARPVGGDRPDGEQMAQFKVVFTPEGYVEVSPWNGWPTNE